TSASPDPAILEVTRRRYRQNLRAAVALEAKYVLFHLNYLGNCKIPNFRPGWLQRELDFWSSFVLEADREGIPVLLENSWEDEPSLISDILAGVDHPNLKICLDLAHATLYSQVPLEEWIEAFHPWLYCCHLNNHNGQLDMHWPLDKGLVDYRRAIELLRETGMQPYLCLEMSRWSDMERSLPYFEYQRSRQSSISTPV
ncbi:MAG: sugar phosphate isomerase/epimerase family protein, partial [Candidatus Promineifilaceae bacterium]